MNGYLDEKKILQVGEVKEENRNKNSRAEG